MEILWNCATSTCSFMSLSLALSMGHESCLISFDDVVTKNVGFCSIQHSRLFAVTLIWNV